MAANSTAMVIGQRETAGRDADDLGQAETLVRVPVSWLKPKKRR